MKKKFSLPGFTADLRYSAEKENYLQRQGQEFQKSNLVLMQRMRLPAGLGGFGINSSLAIGEKDCKTLCEDACEATGTIGTFLCRLGCATACK